MKRKSEKKHSQPGGKTPRKAIQTSNSFEWRKYYGVLALILLISVIAYFPVFQNSLLSWDDDRYITNNPMIFSLNLKALFSRYVSGNYHPVTMLVLAAEYHFFGLNATGYHTVNLLLHLVNVVLVFYAVYLLSDKPMVAVVAALLFGIHPLHVESVAWAAELKDLLYTLFFLASYVCYLKYLNGRHKKFYLLALALFVVSLLSKAMAASLPLVLVLTDYFKGRQFNARTVLEKAPFFLLAIAIGVVAVLAQQSTDALTEIATYTFLQRFVFANYAFINYLFKLLIPLNLSAVYPYMVRSGAAIPSWYYAYLPAFLGLVAIIVYSLRFTKKLLFGVGFYTVTIFLVLQLLPVGRVIMADRYSYIPSIGIFYLAGEGLSFLWSKHQKLVAIITLVAFTLFFSVTTYARCGIWKNDISLWNDVISRYQNIDYAYYNRGIALVGENRNAEALSDFNKSIELNPGFVQAYYNRGNLYIIEKREEEALKDYTRAIGLNPGYAQAYYNRGKIFIKEKRNAEALQDYTKAIELNPGFVQAYYNRGNLFFYEKRNEEALDDYNKVIELKPDHADAYFNRGVVFYSEQRYEEAISNYSMAIRLKPDYAEAYYSRGLAEFYLRNSDAACLDLKHAAGLGYQPAADAARQMCR